MTQNIKQHTGFHRLLFVVTCTVPAALFLLSSSLAAPPQISDKQAIDLARKSVLAGLGKPEGTFLNISSSPAIQQVFAQVPTEGHQRLPFVFHISDEGVEHKGNVDRYHVPVDGNLDALVAVSTAGRVYTIREGSNSLPEFNRLAKDYHVKIESREEALKYLAWYLAVRPYLFLTEIRSEQQLREEAERTIKGWGRSPEVDETNFEAWWQKHERQANHLNYEVQVTRTVGGFLVSFYVLSDIDQKHPSRGLGILRVSIAFSKDGEAGSPVLKKAE